VYGPNEMSFLGQPAAQVRIDSVAPDHALGTVLEGSGRVPNRGRAVLSRLPQGARRLDQLLVYVDPSAREHAGILQDTTFRTRVDSNSSGSSGGSYHWWARATDDRASAHATLRSNGGHLELLVDGEPLPPLVVDYQARRAAGSPAQPLGYEPSAVAICGPLRRAYSAVGLQYVQNSYPQIELEVRVLPAGVTPPQRPAASPEDTVYVGDSVNIWAWVMVDEAAARSTPVFLTAAAAGFLSDPIPLWPTGQGPALALAPDQINRPFRLNRAPIPITDVTGTEVIKAIAGTERFDLRAFMSRLPSCPDGTRTRGLGGEETGDVTLSGWSAAQRAVVMTRRP